MRRVSVLLFFLTLFSHSLSIVDKYPSYSYVFSEFGVDESFAYDSEFKAFVLIYEKKIKRFYTHSLKRGELLLPMMKRRLMEDGLSDLFIYLSMVESGFSSSAISPKKAVGLWQFMPATAKHYNLEVCDSIDERLSPESSTKAAIAYLEKLHRQFGKWYLAMMAYNCGEGRLKKAIKKAGTNELDVLIDSNKKYLPKETREYIQKILLVAMIGENITLGFKNMQKNPFGNGFMKVKVKKGENLLTIAKLLKMKPKELYMLNSEYKNGILPQKKPYYNITIPEDKIYAFYLCYQVESEVFMLDKEHMISYNVQIGDSLDGIAKTYHIKKEEIKMINHLNNDYLELGQLLVLPVSKEIFYDMLQESH